MGNRKHTGLFSDKYRRSYIPKFYQWIPTATALSIVGLLLFNLIFPKTCTLEPHLKESGEMIERGPKE